MTELIRCTGCKAFEICVKHDACIEKWTQAVNLSSNGQAGDNSIRTISNQETTSQAKK